MHILDRRRHHHRNPLLHSPLEAAEEEVELATGVDYRDLEIRLLWAVPPWWESPEVVIEATKERSLLHHNIHCIAYPEAIRIYTNGSGICGRVDTAAVCLGPPICRQRYLGTVHGCGTHGASCRDGGVGAGPAAHYTRASAT